MKYLQASVDLQGRIHARDGQHCVRSPSIRRKSTRQTHNQEASLLSLELQDNQKSGDDSRFWITYCVVLKNLRLRDDIQMRGCPFHRRGSPIIPPLGAAPRTSELMALGTGGWGIAQPSGGKGTATGHASTTHLSNQEP